MFGRLNNWISGLSDSYMVFILSDRIIIQRVFNFLSSRFGWVLTKRTQKTWFSEYEQIMMELYFDWILRKFCRTLSVHLQTPLMTSRIWKPFKFKLPIHIQWRTSLWKFDLEQQITNHIVLEWRIFRSSRKPWSSIWMAHVLIIRPVWKWVIDKIPSSLSETGFTYYYSGQPFIGSSLRTRYTHTCCRSFCRGHVIICFHDFGML